MNRLGEVRNRINVLCLLVMMPLIGVLLSGSEMTKYLAFPPSARIVEHMGFSLVSFIVLAVLVLATVIPFIARVLASKVEAPLLVSSQARPFPAWGWIGVLIIAVSWLLAWTRFTWFDPLQSYTFTPLWIGYILVVNALTFRRSGVSMITHRRRHLTTLFLVSACFWWYFEYLNGFVHNWYYERVESLSNLQYFVFATLPFSTVLPAVTGTIELLRTYPRLSAGLSDWARIRPSNPRAAGLVTVLVASILLAIMPLSGEYLFPLVWLAPLAILAGWQAMHGRRTVLSGIVDGDWRDAWLACIAALVCGFFWEMWNYHSYAKWVYTVPLVDRFHIFEMPLLGYAGYLPFGLECLVVVQTLTGSNPADDTSRMP